MQKEVCSREELDIIKSKIRDIPDFPKKGIIFKDITPLLKDNLSFKLVIDRLADYYSEKKIDYVVAIESRGFIIGSPLAYELGAGFIPIRKKGKLPYKVHRITYSLEYGEDTLEIHEDAIEKGKNVLIIDDLLATGGTIGAAIEMVKKIGGNIVGVAFLIELAFLNGREKLPDCEMVALVSY